MMMYLASGKKKHKRTFWMQGTHSTPLRTTPHRPAYKRVFWTAGKTLCWDKRKGGSPKKSGVVTRFKPEAR